MKLIDWLKGADISMSELADEFGVTIYAVRKWLRGERIPRPQTQARIKRLTKGQVCPDDWMPDET